EDSWYALRGRSETTTTIISTCESIRYRKRTRPISEEILMKSFAFQKDPGISRVAMLVVGIFAASLAAAAFMPAAVAEPPAKDAIPHLADHNFGWQTNVADWQEPP